MQIDTDRGMSLADFARFAFLQAQCGVLSRFNSRDEGWTVAAEACGGNLTGITVICSDNTLRAAVARELRDLGRVEHDKRLHVHDRHFTVLLG